MSLNSFIAGPDDSPEHGLGKGISLFNNLESKQPSLTTLNVIHTPEVTHLHILPNFKKQVNQHDTR